MNLGAENGHAAHFSPPNLCTNIMDFAGLDSSIILMIRGGTLRPIGNFPESLSQAMLVGVMLVGRLGVPRRLRSLGGPLAKFQPGSDR